MFCWSPCPELGQQVFQTLQDVLLGLTVFTLFQSTGHGAITSIIMGMLELAFLLEGCGPGAEKSVSFRLEYSSNRPGGFLGGFRELPRCSAGAPCPELGQQGFRTLQDGLLRVTDFTLFQSTGHGAITSIIMGMLELAFVLEGCGPGAEKSSGQFSLGVLFESSGRLSRRFQGAY